MFYLTHRLGQFLWDQNFEFQYFCGVSEKVTIFYFFLGGGGGGVEIFVDIFWVTSKLDNFYGLFLKKLTTPAYFL